MRVARNTATRAARTPGAIVEALPDVALTVGVLQGPARAGDGATYRGVCSRHLDDVPEGGTVFTFVRRGLARGPPRLEPLSGGPRGRDLGGVTAGGQVSSGSRRVLSRPGVFEESFAEVLHGAGGKGAGEDEADEGGHRGRPGAGGGGAGGGAQAGA